MKKLFLTSYFKEVSEKLPSFLNENLKNKTITFIKTASLVEEINFYVDEAKEELIKLGLTIDELDISTFSIENISQKLNKNDYIYISGGNTFFLLQELKKSGTDKLLIDLINKGKPYIGESAGSMILSPNIEYIKNMDDYQNTSLNNFSALSIIDFYPLPHFGNEPFEEITKSILEEYADSLEIVPFNNSQIIMINEFENNKRKIEEK